MTTEFTISPTDRIMGRTQSSRTGFKHVVEYYRNNNMIAKREVNYYNRTWESFDYETAIKALLTKMGVSDAEKTIFLLFVLERQKLIWTDSSGLLPL